MSENKENKEHYNEEVFIFIYEHEDSLYIKLEDIEKKDQIKVIIHPVYYEGYDNNTMNETIIYSDSEKKYISTSENGSWLDIIIDQPEIMSIMDLSTVVYNEGMYFHCDGDLLFYLLGKEPQIVDLIIR